MCKSLKFHFTQIICQLSNGRKVQKSLEIGKYGSHYRVAIKTLNIKYRNFINISCIKVKALFTTLRVSKITRESSEKFDSKVRTEKNLKTNHFFGFLLYSNVLRDIFNQCQLNMYLNIRN